MLSLLGVPPPAQLEASWPASSGEALLDSTLRRPDLVCCADCVYGSDPGVWERLASTLEALAGPHTLVLQAETRRVEGVLYHLYLDLLAARGLDVHPLQLPQQQGDKEEGGPEVRCWAIVRTDRVVCKT